MRFFKEYCAENQSTKKHKTVLIKKVLSKTNQRLSKKRKVSRELRKCLRKNARYLRIKTGRYIAVFDRAFCQEAKPLDFIEQIDALMDNGQILKNGDTSYVSRLTWNEKDVVVKRYNHRGFIHSLRHTIKRSRAQRGWLHGHRLGTLGIATPKPLAYIEQYKGKLIWKSYLVTVYIEGQKLYYFLRDGKTGQEQRSMAIQQVKKLLDKMGKYRITHGDLKHTNILVTENGPVLTDLDGMKAHWLKWTFKVQMDKDLLNFHRKA
jgi:tRNA A-37 threonylcarbamoyl transferase component Bud32